MSNKVEFSGRQPLGFAFTEGNQAIFYVPSRHRFVIENVDILCGADDQDLQVQFITRWSHMYRDITLRRSLDAPDEGKADDGSAVPIAVNGSSANSFLFSHGESKNSSVVPRDTYIQVWGYLERAYRPESV
jgi:hypothetical protein